MRVGEVHSAGRVDHEIIRRVEPFALELTGQHPALVLRQVPRDQLAVHLASEQLAGAREHQAVSNDKPRRRILKDDLMIEIAVRQPNNSTELARIGNINRVLEPMAIDSLAEAINSAYDKPESSWPSNRRRQLSEDQNKALTAVLAHIKSTANRLGISQGMLCNRKNAEKLVLGKRDLPVLTGWRLDCIGSDLLQLVDQAAN